jgi:hypothetical protein
MVTLFLTVAGDRPDLLASSLKVASPNWCIKVDSRSTPSFAVVMVLCKRPLTVCSISSSLSGSESYSLLPTSG